jgi:uncharacterized protein
MVWYVDTSALVKIVVAEPETDVLLAWLDDRTEPLVASDLARTELMRAVRRVAPELAHRVREVLDVLVLVAATGGICDTAGRLAPDQLRSLDAVHLATALELGDDLDGLVTYDDRLTDAAQAYGIAVTAPGRT